MLRWAVLDGDGEPVGPLHETRQDADRAVRFMNTYRPGLRDTVYRLGLLRLEALAIPDA